MLGISSETTYMEIPGTHVKTVQKGPAQEVPKIILGTKEACREEVLASTQQFFAAVDRRNASLPTGSQLAITEVHDRNVAEVPDIPTPSHPTVTATCRPRTWMQQLTEDKLMNLEEKMLVQVTVTHP